MDFMNDCDIEKWSRRLGFLWVDDEEFKKNCPRLACSKFRVEVRHMISTIMPKEQVAEIKKQLLLYKLSTSMNLNEGKLKKFKSVEEMEIYKKIHKLRSDMANLDSKIADEIEQIKELDTKLGNFVQITQQEEEEKRVSFKTLKKLRMKNKEIQNDIQNFKLSTELLKSFQKISNRTSLIEKPEKSPWDKEVGKTLKSLEPGSEIENITQNLVLLMDKKMPNPISKSIGHIFFAMDEEIVKKTLEVQKYKKILSRKESELEQLRVTINDKSVLDAFMLDKKLEIIKEQTKANAIKEIIESINCTQDIVYAEHKENISKIISNINSLSKEVKFYCQVNIDLLSQKVDAAQKAIEKESQLNLIEDLKCAVSSLKNGVSIEIESILSNLESYCSTSVKLNVPNYLSDSAIFQIIINKMEMIKVLSEFKPVLKINLDENVISKLEHAKKENCFSIDVRIKKISKLIEKIQMLLEKNTAALNFWMNPPFVDYLPGHPEFTNIKNRYIKALSAKNQFNSL